MAVCINHPWIETDDACARCRQPSCEGCLVEFLGQRYCGPCRDLRLHELQGPTPTADAPLAGTNVVDIGGWLNGGWMLLQQDLGVFALATLVAGLISFASCGISTGPMLSGMYLLCFRKMTYGQVELGNLYEGNKRFGNSFFLVLLVMAASVAISFALMIPLFVVMAITRDPLASSSAAMVVNVGVQFGSYIISALLQGITFFAFAHVAARNANPIEALTVSWLVFRRNPLMYCLAGLVFQLVGFLGGLACGVGLLITMPLMLAATAKAYADHFGIRGWDADLAPRPPG